MSTTALQSSYLGSNAMLGYDDYSDAAWMSNSGQQHQHQLMQHHATGEGLAISVGRSSVSDSTPISLGGSAGRSGVSIYSDLASPSVLLTGLASEGKGGAATFDFQLPHLQQPRHGHHIPTSHFNFPPSQEAANAAAKAETNMNGPDSGLDTSTRDVYNDVSAPFMASSGLHEGSPGCNSVFHSNGSDRSSVERVPSASVADFSAMRAHDDAAFVRSMQRLAQEKRQLLLQQEQQQQEQQQQQQQQQQRQQQQQQRQRQRSEMARQEHAQQMDFQRQQQQLQQFANGADMSMPMQHNVSSESSAYIFDTLDRLSRDSGFGSSHNAQHSYATDGSHASIIAQLNNGYSDLASYVSEAPASRYPSGDSSDLNGGGPIMATAAPGAAADHMGAYNYDMAGMSNADFSAMAASNDLGMFGDTGAYGVAAAINPRGGMAAAAAAPPPQAGGRRPRRDTRKRRKRKRLTETKKRELRNEHLRDLNIRHAHLLAKTSRARAHIHDLLDKLVTVSDRQPELSRICHGVLAH